MLRLALRAAFGAAMRRPLASALAGALFLLTALAALPFDPQGPFDARTLEPVGGMRLEYPAEGAAVEPLAALGWVLAGAPDYRAAAVSFLVWIPALACVGSLLLDARGSRLPPGRRAKRALLAAAGSTALFVLYAAFALLVRLPGWRLRADDPDILLADLQSHTFGSHDGLVSAEESLRWHLERGFDVVAVTEHESARRSLEARAVSERAARLPAVITGAETRCLGGYVLALGLGDVAEFPWRVPDDELVGTLRRGHGAAVIALAWGLDAERVRSLADSGVDGFEIANFGHPDVPEDVRAAILEENARRGLVLVSSTDWHGWGGFCRTWTAVRVKGASGISREARAHAVLDVLRSRRSGEAIPVVAGRLGPSSPLRAVFAPFVETVRYAMELSAARVFAWWVWAISVAGAAGFLRMARLRAGATLLAAALATLALPVAWRGATLVLARFSGEAWTDLALWTGLAACAIGLAALAAAAAIFAAEARSIRRRTKGA